LNFFPQDLPKFWLYKINGASFAVTSGFKAPTAIQDVYETQISEYKEDGLDKLIVEIFQVKLKSLTELGMALSILTFGEHPTTNKNK
jgi:hypothetical protein